MHFPFQLYCRHIFISILSTEFMLFTECFVLKSFKSITIDNWKININGLIVFINVIKWSDTLYNNILYWCLPFGKILLKLKSVYAHACLGVYRYTYYYIRVNGIFWMRFINEFTSNKNHRLNIIFKGNFSELLMLV